MLEEIVKHILIVLASVFSIGGNIDLTEPPNTLPPAIISDYTLPEPAVEAINPVSVEVARESGLDDKEKELGCSCIRTAIAEGLKIPLKDAKDLEPNGEPVVGGGVIFYYPKTDTSHVAVIKEFTENGFVIKEGNFKKCVISQRLVLWNDPFIYGFISG